MISERLAILEAMAPLKGTPDAWGQLIQRWPGDTREDGAAFWALLKPRKNKTVDYDSSVTLDMKVCVAIQEKFGGGLWNDPILGEHPSETIWAAHSDWSLGSTTSGFDKGAPKYELLAFFLASADEGVRNQAKQNGQWLKRTGPWLTRQESESSTRGKILGQLLAKKWIDSNAPWEGQSLALSLCHPHDVKSWLDGGGDLTMKGADPAAPSRPLWEVLYQATPNLRDVLIATVPEAYILRNLPSPKRSSDLEKMLSSLKTKRGKATAEEWWKTLTSDPQWMTFRSVKNNTPLWLLALNAYPPVLKHICAHAKNDEVMRSHLSDTTTTGRGIWSVLLHHADSRSLTYPLLNQVAQWVPPQTMKPYWDVGAEEGNSDYFSLGISPHVTLSDYIKNHELRQVLPLSVLLGNDQQQKHLLNNWFRRISILADMGEHTDMLGKELSPELHLAANLAMVYQTVKSNLNSRTAGGGASFKLKLESSSAAVLKALTTLPINAMIAPDVTGVIQTLLDKHASSPNRKEVEEVIAPLVTAFAAISRAKKADAQALPRSSTAVRPRYRS